MKVVIASCFESNEERMGFVYEACKSRGYDTVALTSDFSHIKKEKRTTVPHFFKAIPTRPYKKNLSLNRILSHIRFAEDCFAQIEKEDPDLIWLMVPANSLAKEAGKYKAKHPEKKMIIDIIDMWPESLPVKVNKNVFPFSYWRSLRAKNISCCDALIAECDLYHSILKKEYDRNITTIHWARDGGCISSRSAYPDNALSLCYIGSINNIIDTEKIVSIIKQIDFPVIAHIIGEGEKTESFLESLKKECEVVYHGPVRDKEKKAEIFGQCHGGINIYREDLYIGLTVKCIDYFQHGLPIINNIKGDTWNLVEQYCAGFNLSDDLSIDARKMMMMRNDNQSIYDLFNNNFSKEIFLEKCLKTIDEVMK